MEQKTPAKQDGDQAPSAQVGLTEGKAQIFAGGFPADPGVFIQMEGNRPKRVTATDNILESVNKLASEAQFTLEPNVLLDQIWYLAAPGSTVAIRQDFANVLRQGFSLPE